ncbi:hypothetical protein Desaci_1017 [Desulfosporosinus acidiphilus SJ4]|uniref:Uncharacterized protein n=1 Tax=Desulfosporosinus acidiphilus (strain DSM 22704 / JCM 16185 / SJ4) TaxID=646529 RepID=I4D2N4_DESAJ|nr:hypothetical protein [Desulfosporosinus acidiphilus]AFM40058.1 hypothetical protein Desaci_1017 [Desulfosporosinus acidiphilus SJ4]
MFTQAYSPEQSAFGQLENGRDVLILYVKEFKDKIRAVNQAGLSNYTYDWFATEHQDAYVLQIVYTDDLHIAIRFNTQHFKLIAQLMEPKDVILTFIPLSELMENAQKNSYNFLEFGDVLTFSQLTFSVPTPQYQN